MDKVPDYLHDLNAMHEAEQVLTKETREIYRDQLSIVCEGFNHPISATAAQRAEAFLRTIGKWEE